MDTMLLAITIGSLAIAAVSSAVAWNVTQRERRRRDARVAALVAAAGVPEATSLPSELEAFDAPASDDQPAGGRFLAPDTSGSGSGDRQRWLMGGAAAVATLVLAVVGYSFSSGSARAGTATPVAPLELVSLGHQRADGVLTVTGLVRNPAAGATVQSLEAEVRVFDAAGFLIATRAATVALTTLAAGQDSPFAVPLGEAATAARYRVSFRAGGTLRAHVDGRTHLPASVDRTAEAR